LEPVRKCVAIGNEPPRKFRRLDYVSAAPMAALL
jgi:hypothetical protein